MKNVICCLNQTSELFCLGLKSFVLLSVVFNLQGQGPYPCNRPALQNDRNKTKLTQNITTGKAITLKTTEQKGNFGWTCVSTVSQGGRVRYISSTANTTVTDTWFEVRVTAKLHSIIVNTLLVQMISPSPHGWTAD